MRAAYPQAPEEADNEIREDGIACHWLSEQIWKGITPKLDSLSPNNRVLDDAMFDAVDIYHDVLRSWTGVEVYVEREVSCAAIHPGMKGTPDAWAYDASTQTLYIADLKYGFRFVEVWENWQLVAYITSIIDMLQLSDLKLTVRAFIIQPRSSHRDGPVREWKVPASHLRAQANILRMAAAEAMKPTPKCTPNYGCTDCPARHACVALQQSALTALETSYDGIPLELSPAAVGDELRRLEDAAKRLEARITGLRGQAESLLRAGAAVPYWSLSATYARERWRDGMESQVMTLGKYYNAELAKPATPITPTQARKLLPAIIVDAYAHKPSTGVKLTKQDPFQAKKAFDK